MAVDLGTSANFGRVEVAYLTGDGRAADGTYLHIIKQTIQNGDGVNVFGRGSSSDISLRLEGYQTLSTSIDIDFGPFSGRATTPSLLLSQILIQPDRLESVTTGDDGTTTSTSLILPTDGAISPSGTAIPSELSLPYAAEARIRAFPGRNSLVQLRISTASLHFDDTYQTYVFDQQIFRDINNYTSATDPTALNKIPSRLNDFVRFSLADLASPTERPNLRTGYNGELSANGGYYVYFSGDNQAISSKLGKTGSIFQEIGPDFTETVLGRWAPRAGKFPGTYNLQDANPNPSDPDGNPLTDGLVASYGTFRDYTEVLSGGTTFDMVLFPNSGEEYDSTRQGDIVAFSHDAAGKISHMYFGAVDLQNGTFELFPIRFLGDDPGSAPALAARTSGTLSGYNKSGDPSTIRSFKYAFSAGNSVLGGTATGTATVFRR